MSTCFRLTLMYCSGSIWPNVIFELLEISVNLCFFSWSFLTFPHLGSLLHADLQHADVFWLVQNNFYYVRTVPGSIWPVCFYVLKQLYKSKVITFIGYILLFYFLLPHGAKKNFTHLIQRRKIFCQPQMVNMSYFYFFLSIWNTV